MTKKFGRPPSGERKKQAFVFLSPEHHAWFMALPPKERTAWLAEMIEKEQKSTPKVDNCADSTAHPDT